MTTPKIKLQTGWEWYQARISFARTAWWAVKRAAGCTTPELCRARWAGVVKFIPDTKSIDVEDEALTPVEVVTAVIYANAPEVVQNCIIECATERARVALAGFNPTVEKQAKADLVQPTSTRKLQEDKTLKSIRDLCEQAMNESLRAPTSEDHAVYTTPPSWSTVERIHALASPNAVDRYATPEPVVWKYDNYWDNFQAVVDGITLTHCQRLDDEDGRLDHEVFFVNGDFCYAQVVGSSEEIARAGAIAAVKAVNAAIAATPPEPAKAKGHAVVMNNPYSANYGDIVNIKG